MSEEKKEASNPMDHKPGGEIKPAEPQKTAAEKKPEAKPKAEAKTEAKTEAKAEAKPAEGILEKKRRKVSQMTLQEVEMELKIVQEKMGGFQSNFAQHLLARKKELSNF